jgi:trk system potassium uptake protein TrkH
MLLIMISFVGGCGGSTAGGMKVVRIVILVKAIRLELFQLVHPRAVKPLQLQGATVETRAVDGVMGFVSLYILIFAVLVLVMMGLGMDLETAYGAVASCINNLGPGLGDVATDFQSASAASKWILAFTMLLGRLEIFTFLVLFSPGFWKN